MATRTGKTWLGNDWQETAEEITGAGAVKSFTDFGRPVDSWDAGTHADNAQETTSTNSVTGPYPDDPPYQRQGFNS